MPNSIREENMQITFGIILTLALIGLIGCSDKNKVEADKAVEAMRHSFDQAPDDLKKKYQALTLAIQSNDLMKAKAEFDQLSQANLSPEQQQEMVEKKRELMTKLSTAAQGGDANAAKVIQDLRSRSRSR